MSDIENGATPADVWMSGKPFVVSETDTKLNWGCYKDGKKFRCGLCGYKFKAGDIARFQYLLDAAFINIFVCKDCDGTKEEIKEKMKKIRLEYRSPKFWTFRRKLNT